MPDEINNLINFVGGLVAEGFESRAAIIDSARDYAREFVDDDRSIDIERLVDDEFSKHQKEQATWPAITDCDRLDAAFDELNNAGIVARQHFSCCGTCAAAEIRDVIEVLLKRGEHVRGYTSYDVQSTANAVEGYGVALNYGSTEDGEAAALRIGHEVVEALTRHGLSVEWPGTWDRRIMVLLDWKRRRQED